MKIHVLSIFPQMFAPVVGGSILGRAAAKGILDVLLHDIRDYTEDKHKRVDDTPFGGGAGMVMAAEPFYHALTAIGARGKRILYMSPRGKILDEELLRVLAREEELVLLCGHYEGVDQRVLDYWQAEEVSIGDYILTGGELPAMVLIDAVTRMLPQALGSEASHAEESIYCGLLEYPQYTRPRVFEGLQAPETLLSGHHENIRLWRLEQSLALTYERRPDLLEKYLQEKSSTLTKKEKKVIENFLGRAAWPGKETQ